MQLGLGSTNSRNKHKDQNSNGSYGNSFSTAISFGSPSYTPTISMPYTSHQISFKAKVGQAIKVAFPDLFVSAYISKQYIDKADTLMELPSYGYLHYQTGAQNRASLLDFNREKEMPYREKPAVPHIALPVYTYDAFSITGEGTGGMFRAYRSDIGFVHDHFIRTKDKSGRLDLEIGVGDLVHAGIDLNINRVVTQNGPWLNQNVLKHATRFRADSADFQAVYFRNPGEKSINDKQFYETLGGDDVVTVGLAQENKNSAIITATNYLWRYKDGKSNGDKVLSASNAVKAQRDKRTQVISYLNAQEAAAAGLSKYIEYHQMNQFDSVSCTEGSFGIDPLTGTGLKAEYYKGITLRGKPDYVRQDPNIAYDWFRRSPDGVPGFPGDYYSVRWTGRLKAPVTGTYIFYTTSDDGVRFWLNDSLLIDDWGRHSREGGQRSDTVYLEAGKMYNLKLEYKEEGGISYMMFEWKHKNQLEKDTVPRAFYIRRLL
ncbi:PA14 domain-containing protein [Paraflavitalea speifideaquila]|uniref:PA14 domain-containing protein n=1 Tax=Paraflavitalea speifideaquila TaxID=3076558 RepID=UPI0028E70C01|nr:PA14 domain-containing protein [Paraflavitalea speifideiaquila]